MKPADTNELLGILWLLLAYHVRDKSLRRLCRILGFLSLGSSTILTIIDLLKKWAQ